MAFDLAQTVLMTIVVLGQPPAATSEGQGCGCKTAEAPIRISIETDRVSVLHQASAACCGGAHMTADAFMVSCRELKSEIGSAGGRTVVKLVCSDAEFSTGQGMRGRAQRLVYDSATGGLELHGTPEQHVRLWFDASPADHLHVAARDAAFVPKQSHFRLRGLGDVLVPASACCCESGCVCAASGCCSKRAAAEPAADEPAKFPATEPFERVFQFGGIRFTR